MIISRHINSIEPRRNDAKQRENVRRVSPWIARKLQRPGIIRRETDFIKLFRNVRNHATKPISVERTEVRLVSANSQPKNERVSPWRELSIFYGCAGEPPTGVTGLYSTH